MKKSLNFKPIIFIFNFSLPANYHHAPGAIECLKTIPNNEKCLLIVYNRGLCIIWDFIEKKVIKSFVSPGHGQSVGVYVDTEGDKFTWYHADGSYSLWYIESDEEPDDQKYVAYGPDPCKSIDYLIRGFRGDDEMVIFSGGMPRSAYGDRNCVSIHCNDGTKVALDFTSKVIDFFITFDDVENDQVQVLIVLLEEEFVAYDLRDKQLSPVVPPYLHSIHASAVTCNFLAPDVSAEVYEKIKKVGIENVQSPSNLGNKII